MPWHSMRLKSEEEMHIGSALAVIVLQQDIGLAAKRRRLSAAYSQVRYFPSSIKDTFNQVEYYIRTT